MGDTTRSGRRFLISYAHEDQEHRCAVRRLAELLVEQGLDVRLDQFVDDDRRNWQQWTVSELAAADRVLVVVSETYRRRFESIDDSGTATADGDGVRFEGMLIGDEIYHHRAAGLRKYIPVLLPGATRDHIPTVLLPGSGTRYRVPELTPDGVAELVRLLRSDDRVLCTDVQASHTTTAGSTPTAAVHLAVSGGSPARAEQIVRALLGTGAEVEGVEFDDRSTTSGALATGSVGQVARVIATASRTIHTLLADQELRERTVARLGAHLAPDTGRAVALATRLSGAPIAVAQHGTPGAHLVVVVSGTFLDAAVPAGLYPRRPAFGELPEAGDGEPCWFAVPGRSRPPRPRPAGATAAQGRADPGPAHVVVGDNHGVVNVGTIRGGVHVGTIDNRSITYAGRDLTLTIINERGGRR